MKKAGVIASFFICLLLVLTGCGSSGKDELKFGTGGQGGTYYAYAGQMSELMTDISFDVKTTAGSAANIRLVNENFLDIAIAQSDILASAKNGTGIFAGENFTSGYGAVAALYTEAVQLVTTKDSGIDSVAELGGLTVSIGEKESGVLQNAGQILQAYGLKEEDLDARYYSFSDAADALKNGELDAFFITAGAPTSAVADLAKEIDIKLISIDETQLMAVMNLYDGYVKCTIPAGTYAGVDEDIVTLGVKAVLIARTGLDNEVVESLAENIFKYASDLKSNICTDGELDAAFATDAVGCGFHEGAADYYSRQGISVEIETSGGTSVTAGQDE